MTIAERIQQCERDLAPQFRALEQTAYHNQSKVLDAFAKLRIATRHFAPTCGYGYGDEGRDTLGALFAEVFGAEAGIVSPNILSGTHALTVGLFGLLRTGDTLFSIAGAPYDTLHDVIAGEGNGSLADYGISFHKCELKEGGFDFAAIEEGLRDASVKVVFIQRSRGYAWRDALSEAQIAEACAFVRRCGFAGCIFVDNCYGEFVEDTEREYVDKIACRLTAPSIGAEVGSYAFGYQYFYQGLFFAPHVVCQALKGALLIGACLQSMGYVTSPSVNARPYDITRAIRFRTKEELVGFIQAVQEASPVDSFVTLEPWDMPGYEDQVIMAAGCFVPGASIELSADAPVREPYIAYFQGGLTYEHCRYALEKILAKIAK